MRKATRLMEKAIAPAPLVQKTPHGAARNSR
jgi:hypothetical protein